MAATLATSLSILVVDDEEGIRKLLRHWLERAGHSVACAESGRDASRLLRSQHYDLVITDVVMPDGDGFELISEFRHAQSGTRILAISGGGQYLKGPDCLRIARGLGAHAIVLKPFDWEKLHAGIELALASPPPSATGV